MESPGKFLKRERETRSISLEQISNFTKIKEHHLKAIEEDRYELLPPALYVKGFLMGYARYLNLDPRDIVLQYENYKKSLTPPEPVVLRPEAPPKKKIRQWFLLAVVFTALLSTAFFIFYQAPPPAEKKPQVASVSLITPSPVVSSEAEVRPTDQVRQNPSFGSTHDLPFDKLKALSSAEGLGVETERPNALHSEGWSLPSTRAKAEGAPSKYQLAEPERAEVVVAKEELPVLKVLEAGIGTGVERDGIQQVLIGKCSALGSNNQRGYFFTRIKTQKEGKIAHIWLREGKEYHRIEIDVKPPAWSVYSYFTFRPQHAGNWKAEARDGDHLLTSLNFNVVQSGEDRSL